MSGCAAKDNRIRPTTSVRKVSIPGAGDISSDQKAAQRDAFWADALESTSILAWVATHSPKQKNPVL